LRNPDVPGLWSGKGLVATVRIMSGVLLDAFLGDVRHSRRLL